MLQSQDKTLSSKSVDFFVKIFQVLCIIFIYNKFI